MFFLSMVDVQPLTGLFEGEFAGLVWIIILLYNFYCVLVLTFKNRGWKISASGFNVKEQNLWLNRFQKIL